MNRENIRSPVSKTRIGVLRMGSIAMCSLTYLRLSSYCLLLPEITYNIDILAPFDITF